MLGPRACAPLAREIFQRFLKIGVDGELVNADAGLGRHDLIGGMRRQYRQFPARLWHRFGFRAHDLVARQNAGCHRAVEHAVTRRSRRIGKTVGPAQFRRLRQRD